MNDLEGYLNKWNSATTNLQWGVQRVLLETLKSVQDGQVTLVHGADYKDGKPCLINAAGNLLLTGGGEGIPSAHYQSVVGLFDQINSELSKNGVNLEDGYVSPLAAEILVHHFGELKPEPEPVVNPGFDPEIPYRELSDETFARDWMESLTQEPTTQPVSTPYA